MSNTSDRAADPVRVRLIKAALACFLEDDYHNVTTRAIAEQADSNVSMIRYYFGSKEGLYEEMIRETLDPIFAAFDDQMVESPGNIADFLLVYYHTMIKHPNFPKLILKVLALNQGPGKRYIYQLLERGRARGVQKMEAMKASGQLDASVDLDMVRMAFVSLTITPMLLKKVFEEQMERPLDAGFLEKLAHFNGQLLAAGFASLMERKPEMS